MTRVGKLFYELYGLSATGLSERSLTRSFADGKIKSTQIKERLKKVLLEYRTDIIVQDAREQ